MKKKGKSDSELVNGVYRAESEISALVCAVLFLHALSVTGSREAGKLSSVLEIDQSATTIRPKQKLEEESAAAGV